jgi:predicted PurR-regulated permease PerM
MKKEFPSSIILASRLLVLFLIIALAYFLKSLLVPVLFAIILAITLFPLCRFLEKLKLPRAAASIISVIVAVLIVSGLIYFIVNQVIVIGKNGEDISKNFVNIYDSIQTFLVNKFGIEPGALTSRLREEGQNALSNAGTYISAAFSSAGGTLANAVLVPLYIFFFLYYRDFFKEFFIRSNTSHTPEETLSTLSEIYEVIQSYLLGMVMVMGIVAVLNTGGLLIMGIQYAWFFGTLAALLILIPYIGIAIGSIIPALFALATMDSYWYALGVILWFQVVQFLEGNFITPNIVGGKISLNPLVAIMSLILGGMLFGLAGLILALPLVAAIKIILNQNETTQPFSFVIGEPEKHHVIKDSHQELLARYNINPEEAKPKTEEKEEETKNSPDVPIH